ncbi:MAG TPA: glycosyl hydrolase family protein [Bacteroidetes bacterium]|nr:glycosyl hydrolase family protein [Bacteroidota bacterium]
MLLTVQAMNKFQFILLLLFLFSACKKKNVIPPTVVAKPKIEISDITFSEGDNNETLINVSLTGTLEALSFVEYNTVAGTAKEGEDFEPVSGVLAFTKDETSHNQKIFIEILDDDKFEEEEFFEIHFTADTLVNLMTDKITVTILDNDVQLTDNDFPGYATPMEYEGWNLFWSDEFGGNELDLNNWIQADRGNWFNNELQYYSPNNTEVGNGIMTITAKPEIIDNHNYTSSRMWSHHKIFFKYGRIDIRAKLPYSQGLWPALWMMGENRDTVGWPQCGEIDIMELRGNTPNTVSSTVHFKNQGGDHYNPPAKRYELNSGDFSDEFHVFSMIWDEHKIEFLVDDNLYNSISHTSIYYYNNDNPFLKNFYVLMNVAVGGNFGGDPDATTVWPQTMKVDYVRVFQKN